MSTDQQWTETSTGRSWPTPGDWARDGADPTRSGEIDRPDEIARRVDDAQLDALIDAAGNSRSRSVALDFDMPGGLRALTEQEDRDLIDSIRLPQQRVEEDREHLIREQAAAVQAGDRDAVEQSAEHQRVLDDEQARDQRTDPQLPTRAELDAIYERGDREGWTEQSARAVEYLDLRRDIADERAAAGARGDHARVAYLDRQHEQVDRNYGRLLEVPEHAEPERGDEEWER